LLLLIFLSCFTALYYIIPGNPNLPQLSDFIPVGHVKELTEKDSIKHQTGKLLIDTLRLNTADTLKLFRPDSLNVYNKSVTLEGFLDTLKYSDGQIRIMYYGDSQIEGDRITSFLRQELRKTSGGTGPGLFMPLMPVMYSKSIFIRASSNWRRYNFLSFKNGEIDHKNLGPFMTICRYLQPGTISRDLGKAFIKIIPSVYADSAAAKFDNLRLFYGNVQDVVNLSVRADENQIFADTLKKGKGIKEVICRLAGAKEVLVEFEGHVSPDIYGISIESEKGVIVDNIPQRGSAGLEFTMVEKNNLKEIYGRLDPDLFILQYGLNIVKNVRDEYSYFENGLFRQLSLLKEICPETPILVVGLTDMAIAEGDSVRSYPNITKIRDAQKQAALRSGVAFWDPYEAMGGKSSIIKWVNRKPPLAQKDYVHFTYPGADTISKLLVAARFAHPATDTISRKTGTKTDIQLTPAEKIKTVDVEKSYLGILVSHVFSYNPDKPFIFTTPAFWIFFLVVLAGYSLFCRKLVIRNIYLFLISLFFYFKTGGLFLFLLIFVTAVDYTCGLLINSSKARWSRKFYLLLSLLSNLGLLAYFKYAGFLVEIINNFFGSDIKVYDILSSISNAALGTSFDISYIILPVGISFFTFQSLSYTIDVYRRKMEPVRNIIDFGFYVSFFPHLVAGPIVRASVFIPQIYREYRLSSREFSQALFMISKGLIKKILISNFIAINFIDRVFDAPSLYSGFENLMAVYGYGLQIYCDFSGYTDIAIGVALILGFRLPINFNSPYKASSITDFWKRWHISLSQWLKDYLYISLGGNRKGKLRTYINLMITMLLGGLWHGASLKFIIWGGLHGFGLVVHKIWDSVLGNRSTVRWFGRVLGIFITFQFVSFCWIFFRAENMDNVLIMLKQIWHNFSPGSYLTVIPAYMNVFLLIAVGYIIHFLPEKIKESYRGLFIKIPLIAQLAVIMLIAILLYQLRTTEIMPFIYFRF
jgi:D-alanyl-lipoteichoic acid acyltransferase DltB (MBOAT superfamily)